MKNRFTIVKLNNTAPKPTRASTKIKSAHVTLKADGTVIVRDPAIEASVSGNASLPLGADVRVSLVEADPVRRVTRFELAE